MILLFVHTCEEYLCVKDIFDRLEKSITMSITNEGSIWWKSSRLHLLDHRASWMAPIRIRNSRYPAWPASNPCAAINLLFVVRYLLVQGHRTFFIIFQLVSPAPSLFFPNFCKRISPLLQLVPPCSFVSTFRCFLILYFDTRESGQFADLCNISRSHFLESSINHRI